MIAKVDAAHNAVIQQANSGQPQAEQPKQRPDSVPEKFWDAATGQVRVDDLVKSYKELESSKGPAAAAASPDAMQAAEAAVTAAKLDMNSLSAEFAKDGKLSDASYAALGAAGIDKTVVDQFIAGQVAVQQGSDKALMDSVGGEAAWNSMAEWANVNLTEADHNAFNAAVAKGGDNAKLAMAGLKAKYEAAVGTQPKLLSGNNAASTGGVQPFASRAEVTAAMRDPKYRNDPAYRAQVIARIDAMDTF